ncbi:MAG: Do family serine endopeptidase, partial [Pirellulales bacterium]
MKTRVSKRRVLAAALVAGLMTSGAATTAFVHGYPTPVNTPVVYTNTSAPDITPEEAVRATSSAKDLSTAFRVAADKVLPSVVTIETTTKPKAVVKNNRNRRSSPTQPFAGRNPFAGTPFEDMFKELPMDEGESFRSSPDAPRSEQGLGSGVIIDKSGLILTNNHVVAGGDNVNVLVRLQDGREFNAEKVWTDPKTDIAVVHIADADDLVAARMADSDRVAVGDWVLALGQPFGLESTVTAGIVSATHRGVGINARESFLQTDAAINPGNSGGPLVNLDGEIVGINTAISSRGGGNDGVGFAVPINLAKWVSDQLVKTGTVRRAYLGVGIQPVSAALAKQFHVKPREGVVVTDVYPDTPAAKSGLKSGDVIRSFAGAKVDSPRELQLLVERAELGRPHMVEIMREGKAVSLTFIPEAQPDDYESRASNKNTTSQSTPTESSAFESLGMEVSDLDAPVAKQLRIEADHGVVVTDVAAGSAAARSGLSSGMVIVQINRQPVSSVAECRKMLAGHKPGESVLLLVKT